jgi:hypothetical protein
MAEKWTVTVRTDSLSCRSKKSLKNEEHKFDVWTMNLAGEGKFMILPGAYEAFDIPYKYGGALEGPFVEDPPTWRAKNKAICRLVTEHDDLTLGIIVDGERLLVQGIDFNGS